MGRPVPAFGASRSSLLAEPPLGEPQPCDIDINPLAHHSGSRLSYLRLLSLIATARWPRASADDPALCRSQSLLFFGKLWASQRAPARCMERDQAPHAPEQLAVRARNETGRTQAPANRQSVATRPGAVSRPRGDPGPTP